MAILLAADAGSVAFSAVALTGSAAPRRGAWQLCTRRMRVAPGSRAEQAHRLDRDEAFMVLAGTVRITPGGEVLHPGDSLVVPAGEPIAVENPGTEPAEVYIAIAAGFTATMDDGTVLGTPPWAA